MTEPTIRPLSRTKRRSYFTILIAIFAVAVPVLFLYATGYRFEGFTGLVKTGGIYVGADRSEAEIYINDELVRETGTFRRAFFIQDLEPGIYTVLVKKEGYYPWGKTLPVYAHIVTEAQAFNMPLEPTLTLIAPTIPNPASTSTASSTLPNPLYLELDSAFSATSTRSALEMLSTLATGGNAATSTRAALATTTKESQGLQLRDEGKHVAAHWVRSDLNIPYYFCVPERECAREIILNTKGEKPSSFDFFPGRNDLIIVTLRGGVYVTELDNRSGQNIQPLVELAGADFRVVDSTIYVRNGEDIFRVEL